MRVGLVSDLHEHFPDLNNLQLDGLIIAGDISFKPYMDIRAEREMWRDKFIPWIGSLDLKYINVMSGNHDWFPYLMPNAAKELLNLTNNMVKFVSYNTFGYGYNYGKVIGYVPFSLAFCNWAFQATETQMKNLLDYLGKCDIIVSHGPVNGYGDTDRNGSHGSLALLKYIEDYSPKFVFTGHIHSGRGIYRHEHTTIVNCAFTDDSYHPINKIYIWDTDTDEIIEEKL